MLQQQVCSEKKNQTSFIVHEGKITGEDYQVSTFSKKILLQQQPEEVVHLKCSLVYVLTSHQSTHNNIMYYARDYADSTRYRDSREPQFEYDFTLTFKNNLHEMSNDYGYEIEVYQQVYDKDLSSHILLFSQKHSRQTKQISIRGVINHSNQSTCSNFLDKLLIDTNDRHICCSIRRYNTKTAVVDVFQQPTVNVGAMLLERGLYSDVSLVVGEKLFRVHKEILSSSSDIFKAMFSHEMIEVQNGEVIIEDFNPDVVEGLLSFIYTGKTSLLSKKPLGLFRIADKYQVHILKAQCVESFPFLMNKKNAVNMLAVASMYELIDFEANLRKYISIHEEEMVKEESYQQFLSNNLKIESVVYTLKMCDKYEEFLNGVETITFQFVKKYNKDLLRDEEFLKLFESHPSLMKRLYVFIHEND